MKSAAIAGGALLAPKLLMAGGAPSYGQTELIHTIRRCGLTSGLQLCLDAGDANSYSGSGQSWLDTSGNGYDFFRGATGSAAGDDPTFNGTAGRRSSGEYWSFDGGDLFRYDSANEAWMSDIHKDNAKFTLAAWVYFATNPSTSGLCGTSAGSGTGVYLIMAAGAVIQFAAQNAGVNAFAHNTGGVPVGSWVFYAISIDEAAGASGSVRLLNALASSFDGTYTSPSAGAASYTMGLGEYGNGGSPMLSGDRLGMFAAWSGVALTKTQLNALYQTTRGRYGV